MAKDDPNHGLDSENTGGVLSGLLAEEDEFDRRSLWRLGSWGAASVGAVIVAVLASQFSLGVRRDQVAAADLVRQSQQIQSIAKESQGEARRLASAIETLNGDRDRLYSRVTVLEQGLDSVTGAIARQSAAATAPTASWPSAANEATPVLQGPPLPTISPVATTGAAVAEKPRAEAIVTEKATETVKTPETVASVGPGTSNSPALPPSTPLVASKSMMAPPDAAATKLIEPERPAKAGITSAPMSQVVASAPPVDESEEDAAEVAPARVLRTEFGVDIGGANSVGGLRALWRGLLKSRSNAALTALRPIMVIRESSNGLGMQLRLVAGPLADAAAAAKICAGLAENDRPCETTVYDGQRLAMKADDTPAVVNRPNGTKPDASKSDPAKPDAAKPVNHRRSSSKRAVVDPPAKKPDPPSTFSSLFGKKN
jgi:hypothetical protein